MGHSTGTDSLELAIRFDMRAPAFGAPPQVLYAAAHEMARWADDNGFHTMQIGEHHGAEDGYTSAPFVVAASLASGTNRIRVRMRAMLLPLHDPIIMAEQISTLDLLLAGRTEVVFGLGYAPIEFEMLGIDPASRVKRIESGIQIIKQAVTGRPFDYRGTTIAVTPAAVQKPHPPLFLGGGVEASARRAARLEVGFAPQVRFEELTEVYHSACRDLGNDPGQVMRTPENYAVFVCEDPEALWPILAPHVAHNANSYAAMAVQGSISSPYSALIAEDDLADVRLRGGCRVVTPEECVTLAREVAAQRGILQFVPLLAGVSPDIGWRSLELFAGDVAPKLRAEGLI